MGTFDAFAAHGVEQRGADVEIQRVAEFVGARDAAGFDAGRQIARIVAAEAALAERAQQVLERLEAEKIDGLVGDFKSRFVLRSRRGPARLARAAFFPAAV